MGMPFGAYLGVDSEIAYQASQFVTINITSDSDVDVDTVDVDDDDENNKLKDVYEHPTFSYWNEK